MNLNILLRLDNNTIKDVLWKILCVLGTISNNLNAPTKIDNWKQCFDLIMIDLWRCPTSVWALDGVGAWGASLAFLYQLWATLQGIRQSQDDIREIYPFPIIQFISFDFPGIFSLCFNDYKRITIYQVQMYFS